ncbi:hypothetical protein GCM10009818_07800 [Nakamurella flavida]
MGAPGAPPSDTVIAVSILQTVATFVVAPAALYGLIALLTLVPSRAKKRPRYAAGQSWDYPAQWWAGDAPVVVSGTGVSPAESRGGAHGTW